MTFVVDLVFSRRSRDIQIPKELAIIPVDAAYIPPVTVLFKPSSFWSNLLKCEKRMNSHLEKKYHKIPWSSGTTHPSEITKILQSNLFNASTIYVYTTKVKKFVESICWDK